MVTAVVWRCWLRLFLLLAAVVPSYVDDISTRWVLILGSAVDWEWRFSYTCQLIQTGGRGLWRVESLG
jgi:hypothetical protein